MLCESIHKPNITAVSIDFPTGASMLMVVRKSSEREKAMEMGTESRELAARYCLRVYGSTDALRYMTFRDIAQCANNQAIYERENVK